MIKLFRTTRQNLINSGKVSKYLTYAIGEIILVVLGILIAIQINDWNRENNLLQEEYETYQLIIDDLRRDSVLFANYKAIYNRYLDTYFAMNRVANGDPNLGNVTPDFIASNVEFNPTVQANHQATIEKLRNEDIRSRINSYFRRLNQGRQATDEFNKLIEDKTRPFFIEDQNVLDNSKVFNYNDRTFPPLLRKSIVDTVKLKQTATHPYFIPYITELRMSIGFYLAVLDISIKENQELIELLSEVEN